MPYSDYSNFDQSYFEGESVDNPHPEGFGFYPDEPLEYDKYAQEIDDVTGNQKVLVVGCAYGYAIRYLINNHGWDSVYGMDISQWAVDNAFSDVADRIFQGDARNSNDYESIARNTQGKNKWDGIYSEYLLSHFTDEEAQNVHDIMLNQGDTVIHRIWSGTGKQNEEEWFNIKTVDEWQTLLGTNDDVEWIDYDNPEDSTI